MTSKKALELMYMKFAGKIKKAESKAVSLTAENTITQTEHTVTEDQPRQFRFSSDS